MVVTKVFQIKNTHKLNQSMTYIEDIEKTAESTKVPVSDVIEVQHMTGYMDYITNDQKTQISPHQQLVSCYGVTSPETAADEFSLTRLQAKQVKGSRSNGQNEVLAHHIIQSFSPEDSLTPQEVHELGRKTILELTGGHHEFVIATHMDRGHLHNHIIFNTTSSVNLTKFRWQKGTARNLFNISNKHAELAGAKILGQKMVGSRKSYAAYRSKHSHRYEIKERLNFLLKHATSWEDFLVKAQALELYVDASGKEVRYRLLDKDQERHVRDGSLSKKGRYRQASIAEHVAKNKPTLTTETIKQAYLEHKTAKNNDFELRLIIQPWQVQAETKKGLHLEVDYGLANSGTVFIPAYQVDQLDDGSYELFIKKTDYFYFINPNKATANRYMRGDTLAKQLSYDNGEAVIKKSPYISRLDNLLKEFSFLSAHDVTSGQQFEELVDQFRQEVIDTQTELDRLDDKLALLNKASSALIAIETGEPQQMALGKVILEEEVKLPMVNKAELTKLIKEVSIERQALHAKFDQIKASYKQHQAIKDNVKAREQDKQL